MATTTTTTTSTTSIAEKATSFAATEASSFDSISEAPPIEYSMEELDAMRQVRQKLKEDHEIEVKSLRALALTTIICKLKVDESVKKYMKFLEALNMIDDFPKEWNENDFWSTNGVEDKIKQSYVPCGTDENGRSIMWVKSESLVYPEDLLAYAQSGILYWMAIHADTISLREGVNFVFDLSNRPSTKTGMEQKIQKLNQAFPARPQSIHIAGASYASRIAINVVIKIASVFTKVKVLERIRFMSVDEAVAAVPHDSVPTYLGGKGGGIDNIVDWTKERINMIPEPDL